MRPRAVVCAGCSGRNDKKESILCKRCFNEKKRDNYNRNKEKILLSRNQRRNEILSSKKKYYGKNKDEILKKSKADHAKRKDNPEHKKKLRSYSLKRKYGIDYDAYMREIEGLSNTCPLCLSSFSEIGVVSKSDPCVDHDHESGTIRGIICRSCNCALGHVSDRVDTLIRMVEYLERHRNA